MPAFTWQYTTCRSEFKTMVHPSGSVTGRTVASELVWMQSSSMPLSHSSLRTLFRLTSLVRTPRPRLVLQRCFLPLAFVPVPVCLKCFSLSPGSARWLTPGQVPWPSLRLDTKGLELACPCLTAFTCAHLRGVSQRSTSGMTDTPIHMVPSTVPDQTSLSSFNVVFELCNTATPCFSQCKSCVTQFAHQLGWETSRTVVDRTLSIVASRALDTTSSCSHSEKQPRNRDRNHAHEQSVFLHVFQYTATEVSSPWH